MFKKFFSVMAVLFVGVSLFLAGCGGDDGGTVYDRTGAVYGGVSPSDLQDVIDKAEAEGRAVTLNSVTLSDAGVVNLRSAKIVGTFTTDDGGGTVINARSAIFAPDATIDAQGAGDVILVEDKDEGNVTGVTPLTAFAESVTGTLSEDTAFTGNLIFNDAAAVTAFANFANSNTVYVTGTTSIAGADLTNAAFMAMGDTTATGTVIIGADVSIGTLKAGNGLIITSVGTGGVRKLDLSGNAVTITAVANINEITNSGGAVAVQLNAQTAAPKVTVDAGNITLTTSAATLTVDGLSTPGAGHLVIAPSAVTFEASAGGGKIVYGTGLAAAADLALTSVTGLTYADNLATTGTLDITGGLAVTGNLSAGATTLSSGNLTVTGTAALGTFENSDASVVTFNGTGNNTVGAVTGGAALTLAGTGAVTLTSIAATTGGVVVASGANVTVTGAATITASTSIDASAGAIKFGDATGSVTLTKGTLTSATGLAAVGANGAVTLGFDTDVASSASLVLDDGGTIATAGTGNVSVGGGNLVLGGDGAVFTASAATTIGFGTDYVTSPAIEGAANGAIFAVSGSNGSVVVAAAAVKAILGKVTLDLSASGTLTVTANGKLTLGTGGTAGNDAGILLSSTVGLVGSGAVAPDSSELTAPTTWAATGTGDQGSAQTTFIIGVITGKTNGNSLTKATILTDLEADGE